jgi:hypothetical protein
MSLLLSSILITTKQQSERNSMLNKSLRQKVWKTRRNDLQWDFVDLEQV